MPHQPHRTTTDLPFKRIHRGLRCGQLGLRGLKACRISLALVQAIGVKFLLRSLNTSTSAGIRIYITAIGKRNDATTRVLLGQVGRQCLHALRFLHYLLGD